MFNSLVGMQFMEIPNHQLLRRIGEGGFGEVWLARTITGKLRAVKIVRRERFECGKGAGGLSDEGVDRLFQMEFMGVKIFEDISMHRPELIHIHTVGLNEEGDMFYYVMPLADNLVTGHPCEDEDDYQPLTLDTLVEKRGAMPLSEAMRFLKRIAEGVAALHRVGLVHRDLSSSNILIVNGKPVVADPGLTSFELDQLPAISRGFSAPEGHSNSASDIYSLGKLFYQMISGRHPADHYPMLPESVYQEEGLAHAVELLDRCCAPEPEKRFADAEELLAFLMPEAVSSPPARGYRSWLIPFTMILLTAIVWLVLSSRKTGHAQEGAPPPAYAEIEEGTLSVFAEKQGQLLWKKDLGMPLAQAEVTDLDGDGVPEVLCAIKDTGNKDTGRMLVYEGDGALRWSFDGTLDFQNYPNFTDQKMKLAGFHCLDLDGEPGKELVLVMRNALDWYPCSLLVLNAQGKLRSCYWHPGHIHPQDIIFSKQTPAELPMLVFKGLNNSLSKPFNDVGRHRACVGMIDPRAPGHHGAPPGIGNLEGKDQMTLWYRILDPQHAMIRSIHAEDFDNDGKQEITVWYATDTRVKKSHPRINRAEVISFEGVTEATRVGDGHVAPAKLKVKLN